jgi:putative SOS response-associated peptidase YedK
MCGRYRLTATTDRHRVRSGPEGSAPWQQVAIIRQHPAEPRRVFSRARWGLIPYWAKDSSFGLKTINAMSETAAEKPAFRDALRFRRCLIPADGFYEWKRVGAREKQPYQLQMADGSSFAFAGLWERWQAPDKEIIETCTILTTKPNALVSEVYDRMPVIVASDDYDLWLDPDIKDPNRIAGCLGPFDATLMKKYPVSARVNRPDNDDEECAREVPVELPTPLLF